MHMRSITSGEQLRNALVFSTLLKVLVESTFSPLQVGAGHSEVRLSDDVEK